MKFEFDLIVRGGRVADGCGGEPVLADVGIVGDRIAAVGVIGGRGREEVDATGKLVTPGFVDIHTHYDGQATWENTMAPSSGHGVSTVVTGNCGVGFAPCRPEDRDTLVAILEGVEDIPEVVMAAGLPWNWQTFPEYLDALAERTFDVDVATQVPHSPLRVYVMGERGAKREPSTDEDRCKMRDLVSEAIAAGAFGVTTSRSHFHRRLNGELSPSVEADVAELLALGAGLKDAGRGVFQVIPEIDGADEMAEFEVLKHLATECGRPLSFTLAQSHATPMGYRDVLAGVQKARAEGLEIRAQIIPRPIGTLFGLELSLHPFKLKPSFRPLEPLPLAEKVKAMCDPLMREKLLAETREDPNPLLLLLTESSSSLYELGDPPNYFPSRENSFGEIARRTGRTAEEVAYDTLVSSEGRAILYRPGSNFAGWKDDAAAEQLRAEGTVIGLGDGGAHYGMICDASYPSFVLTYWARDVVQEKRLTVGQAVRALSSDPAAALGFKDRGRLAVGLKADVNVIDFERLALHAPKVERDLPAGGRRLTQKATGYVAAIVSGVVTYRNGEATGALPGRLVRSRSV